jgi:3-hydroxy-9,10-secoandrosta-1,3,5(10)-triene-9,17-dione monooxygenase reductase component
VSEHEPPSASPDAFREILAHWASGVCVVTTNADAMLYGLTVSSFTALSLDPPLVLVCLSRSNRLVQMIEGCKGFAVTILAREQIAASRYFARPGRLPTTDFTEIEGEWTPVGQPVIAGALAWMTCALHAIVVQGDHSIVIGKVTLTHVNEGKEPLLYYSRGYRGVGPPE